jgi:methionyl-tRNA synthetase
MKNAKKKKSIKNMKSSKGNFYITTAIDYVNSLPHIGTAYEKIGADIMARWMRRLGYEVNFQMGNDEHSTNVIKAAKAASLDPKKYCDQMREKFELVWKRLNISYDNFIQTSEERHIKGVQELFKKIYENGDIVKSHYEGWYCESCEAFYTEKDLVDGVCPNHKAKPKWIKEENYFFKLSKYQEPLLKYIAKHPEFIQPESRRNEILNLIKQGLQDISVSRAGFEWGIPVPFDNSHVVYVWFDA